MATTNTPTPEGAAGKNPILEARTEMVRAKEVFDKAEKAYTNQLAVERTSPRWVGNVVRIQRPGSTTIATISLSASPANSIADNDYLFVWGFPSPSLNKQDGRWQINARRSSGEYGYEIDLHNGMLVDAAGNDYAALSFPAMEFAIKTTAYVAKWTLKLDKAWRDRNTTYAAYLKKKAAYEKLFNGSYMDTPPKPKKDKDKNSGGGGGGGDQKSTPKITDPNAPVKYNIPSVKTSYFRNDALYTKPTADNPYNGVLFTEGGSPASAEMVRNANKLWLDATNHKGMIQTYAYWRTAGGDGSTSGNKVDPNLPEYFGQSRALALEKFGFQFLYNPPTVRMGWSGAPVIDVGNVVSGNDTTPFIVPAASSSTLGFQILLNRTADLSTISYYGVDEVVKNYKEIYGAEPEDVDIRTELTAMKNLGTMYDVEYLLKTLVGFEMYSRLRNRKTADIGFLMGYPVELHLGKDLRYLGTITQFEVVHEYFSRDMIPLRSYLDIAFERRIEPEANTQGPTTRTNTDINNTASSTRME